jgi:hypothetical protein
MSRRIAKKSMVSGCCGVLNDDFGDKPDFAEFLNSCQCVRKVLEENRQIAVAIIS